MVILQFHEGVQVTPATGAHFGHFDPGDPPRRELQRRHDASVGLLAVDGAAAAEARARCALLPKVPALEGMELPA